MSIELYARIKILETRVGLLEESITLLLAPPVRIQDPEPKDKRTREWREWSDRNPTPN